MVARTADSSRHFVTAWALLPGLGAGPPYLITDARAPSGPGHPIRFRRRAHRYRRPRAAGLLLLPCPAALRQHSLSALRTGKPGAARGGGTGNPAGGAARRDGPPGPRPG